MKRVSFIPGVEGMSGILAGRAGKLVYPSNDNKAFDAPNGRQYARNYGSRIVLAQRAKDGAAFFMCKTKSATNLSAQSRTNMAVLGSIKPIVVAMKDMSSLNLAISQVYNALKNAGSDRVAGLTKEQYIEAGIRNMLKTKSDIWSDAAVVSGAAYTFTMTNPYYLVGGGNNPQIKPSIFAKFLPYLAVSDDRKQGVLGTIKIDGTQIYIPYAGASGTTMPAWAGVVGDGGSFLNENYQTYLTNKGLELDADADTIKFNDMSFYKPTSQTAEGTGDTIVADTAYTTIQPEV